MYSFYIVRGYTPDYFANIGFIEKLMLYHARDKFYKEESEKYKALFGEK